MTTEAATLQQQIDKQTINRIEDKMSSLNSVETSFSDKAWQRKVAIGQAVITGGTLGLLKVSTALLPENSQKALQPLIMVAQGAAGLANIFFKASDKNRDENTRAGINNLLKEQGEELEALKSAYDIKYGVTDEEGTAHKQTNTGFNETVAGAEQTASNNDDFSSAPKPQNSVFPA